MISRTHLCGGSSPRLAPAPVSVTGANVREVAGFLPAARVLLPLSPRPLGPEEGLWREIAADPRTVAFLDEAGQAWRAAVGEEPATREDLRRRRRELGHGGRGFALVSAFGEETVTHDLWAPERVPAAYARLFRATHVGYRALSDAEESAYWAARERAA